VGTVVGSEAMKETHKSAVEEEDVETSRKPGIMRLMKKMMMRRKIVKNQSSHRTTHSNERNTHYY